MNTRFTRGRAGVLAGVVGVLVLAGCDKPSPRVAQVTPETTPDVPPPTTTPATTPDTSPTTKPANAPGGISPFAPGLPPAPGTPPATGPATPAFVPPSSPTFTQPEGLPGAQLPGTTPTPQPPAPQPPAPQPPAPQPPASDPAKPANPPTGTQPEAPQPDPAKPAPSKKVDITDRIGGKDLMGWLAELKYTGGGPVQRDDQVRETAVKMIPSFGPDARKPAVRPLIDAIREDPDPGVQIAAITVVSSMGFDMRDEVKPVMQELIRRLGTSSSGNIVRMYCVRSLASFGPDAASAIGSFKNVCLDPSWETRREVAIALSMVGAAPVDDKGKPKMKDGHPIGPNLLAVDTLLDYQMQDKSVAVRLEAAKSLLSLGPISIKDPVDYAEKTKKPRETIEKAVLFESGKGPKTNARGASPDRGVYVWALLLQIMYDHTKTNDNLKELAKLVSEPSGPKADEVRLYAIQALGMGGGLIKEVDKTTKEKVVKALGDALSYDEPALLYTALQSLAMIGREADGAIPAVDRLAAKPPRPAPEGSPKGTPPDDSLQRMAKQTSEVLSGKRKFEDFGKEDPKAGEKKDDVKATPPK